MKKIHPFFQLSLRLSRGELKMLAQNKGRKDAEKVAMLAIVRTCVARNISDETQLRKEWPAEIPFPKNFSQSIRNYYEQLLTELSRNLQKKERDLLLQVGKIEVLVEKKMFEAASRLIQPTLKVAQAQEEFELGLKVCRLARTLMTKISNDLVMTRLDLQSLLTLEEEFSRKRDNLAEVLKLETAPIVERLRIKLPSQKGQRARPVTSLEDCLSTRAQLSWHITQFNHCRKKQDWKGLCQHLSEIVRLLESRRNLHADPAVLDLYFKSVFDIAVYAPGIPDFTLSGRAIEKLGLLGVRHGNENPDLLAWRLIAEMVNESARNNGLIADQLEDAVTATLAGYRSRISQPIFENLLLVTGTYFLMAGRPALAAKYFRRMIAQPANPAQPEQVAMAWLLLLIALWERNESHELKEKIAQLKTEINHLTHFGNFEKAFSAFFTEMLRGGSFWDAAGKLRQSLKQLPPEEMRKLNYYDFEGWIKSREAGCSLFEYRSRS